MDTDGCPEARDAEELGLTFSPVSGLPSGRPGLFPRLPLSLALSWPRWLQMLQRDTFEGPRLSAAGQAPCRAQRVRLMLGGVSRGQEVSAELVQVHPGARALLGEANTSGENLWMKTLEKTQNPSEKIPTNTFILWIFLSTVRRLQSLNENGTSGLFTKTEEIFRRALLQNNIPL